MGVNERLPLLMEFKRENFHSEYIIKELESERVRSCINVNALHKNEFDELGLLFRIVGNEDEQFINDIMTLSPLSRTDLLGAHRTQVLISKSRDESKSSIEDLNKNIKEGRVLQEESIDARFRKISDELYLVKEEMHNGKEEISKSRNFIVESLRVPKRSSFHILNFILLTVVLVLILLR
jgi:archaellum component FlaC